jgi:hypothetical protein
MMRSKPCLATILFAAHAAVAASVQVTTIEGDTTTGTWMGYSATRVQLRTAEGVATIPTDELAEISFATASPADAGQLDRETPDHPHRFILADGSTIPGKLVDGDDQAILARTILDGQTRLPFSQLAAVVFRPTSAATPAAETALRTALDQRRSGRDLIITTDDRPKSVPGTLLRLASDSGTFRFGARDRRFSYTKIHAIVFARPAVPPPAPLHRVALVGGGAVAGELIAGSESELTLSAYGQTLEVPVKRVLSVNVQNPRVAYLGDMEPADATYEGLVHRAWPHRRNRNVGNGPLRLDGRRYHRGLGMHARSALSYALDGAFDRFAATIGVDDAVGNEGRVRFLVHLDGKQIYESAEMRGGRPPEVIRLDVTGGQTLTLAVAFAGNADVGDWADWADARLIRDPP